MKNSEILKQVKEQADHEREIEDRINPRRPGRQASVVPNIYAGPLVDSSAQKLYNIKTRVNKVPVILKLKSPFMVWPGDELHLSLVPPFLAATGLMGERYSTLEVNYQNPSKGNVAQ